MSQNGRKKRGKSAGFQCDKQKISSKNYDSRISCHRSSRLMFQHTAHLQNKETILYYFPFRPPGKAAGNIEAIEQDVFQDVLQDVLQRVHVGNGRWYVLGIFCLRRCPGCTVVYPTIINASPSIRSRRRFTPFLERNETVEQFGDFFGESFAN